MRPAVEKSGLKCNKKGVVGRDGASQKKRGGTHFSKMSIIRDILQNYWIQRTIEVTLETILQKGTTGAFLDIFFWNFFKM